MGRSPEETFSKFFFGGYLNEDQETVQINVFLQQRFVKFHAACIMTHVHYEEHARHISTLTDILL